MSPSLPAGQQLGRDVLGFVIIYISIIYFVNFPINVYNASAIVWKQSCSLL